MKRPRGRIPKEIREWLAVWGDGTPWEVCVCSCGRWYHRMDYLAPYHLDQNWCPRCNFKCSKRKR